MEGHFRSMAQMCFLTKWQLNSLLNSSLPLYTEGPDSIAQVSATLNLRLIFRLNLPCFLTSFSESVKKDQGYITSSFCVI